MDDCIEWPGLKYTNGYGVIGTGRGKPRILAHRFIYSTIHGPIAEGVEIRHTCDNPPCVKPSHLIPGTHAENMADIAERDRWRNQYRVPDECSNGHDLTNTLNVRIGKDRRWHCRPCSRDYTRRSRERRESL